MSATPIDLDAEAILFDGQWRNHAQLVTAIREKLDAGDYAIGRHSAALEQLTTALADARTLAFRVPTELAEQLAEFTARDGRAPGAVLREALIRHLASSTGVPPTPPNLTPAANAAKPTSLPSGGADHPPVERRWFGE